MSKIDWVDAYCDYATKPATIDTTSSPTTVYMRKDYEVVESTDPETNEVRKQWKYKEKTMTQDEYALAVATSEMTTLRHDADVIDAYTLELLEEGVI